MITLILLAALGTAGTFFFLGLNRTIEQSARVDILRQELRLLEQGIAQNRDQEANARAWRDLARTAEAMGLRPNAWHAYPVTISRDLAWDDLATVILIASNAAPRPGAYWFQPSLLQVVRVETELQDPEQPPARQQADTERYSLRFEGHFLIPETSDSRNSL